ncbi:actin nucleation-promoting factor WASL-like [Eleutherodactylus coqui]|uniref:actin nucleation-promoting factor WASL-like n=1 Tax=Eleutherodactylus coqui TaxID=57060 RepID=UPI0034628AA2
MDNGSVYYTPKESLTGRAQKGKLNKLDIGSPTNFQHVTHVGFNAVPDFDASSEMELKTLFNVAGVKEEHLQNQEEPHRIFSVLQKTGGMAAVRKQTRRMTSVDRSSMRTRLRNVSSSSIASSKRPSCLDRDFPHAAKISTILERGSPLHLPSLSKVPPPMETPPPPFSLFPSMRPLPHKPPYLAELSQSFSPSGNSSVGRYSRKRSIPSQPLPAENIGKTPSPLLPVAQGVGSKINSPPLPPSILGHSCPPSTINVVSLPPSLLPYIDGSSDTTSCVPTNFPSSIPCTQPPIEQDVESPPLYAKFNSKAIALCNPKECSRNTDPTSAAIPPPPPPPPVTFKKQSPENPLFNRSELLFASQIKETNNSAFKLHEDFASSKELEQQTNPAIFLDQIKQGVQLKCVTQTVKSENSECVNITTALMDVIKRRHKAIQSSDEDEAEEEDWED